MGLHEFDQPDEPLEFTGERYTSAVGAEIAHEHLHRYLLALRWCSGRRVVDVACGEGYGSSLLGTVAAEVVGVDASAEAVEHAAGAYGSETVRFHASDAASMPVEDGWADVVVSFETLEHLEDHEAFLAEIDRVLRPGGLLVLSTPDRSTYLAEEGSEPNPFHLHELDRAELAALLGRHFARCVIGGQRADRGSAIAFPSETAGAASFFDREGPASFRSSSDLPDPVFLIAVATDGELPEVGPSTLLDRDDYLPRIHAAHRHELDAAQSEYESLEKDWDELADRFEELAKNHEDLDSDLQNARRQLVAAEERIAMLQKALVESNQAVDRVGADLERAQADATRERVLELERTVRSLRKELERSRHSLSWRLAAPIRALAARIRPAPPEAPFVPPAPPPRRRVEELPPPPPTLLRFPDDDELPEEIRDEAIVVRARAWSASHAPARLVGRLGRRPLISVLLPAYNTPPGLLEAAVRSVLEQSYPEWELVVVDDASTRPLDPPLEELERWDERIRVTRLGRNGGISEATNAALHLARGEYVAMLDHDDELHPHALLEIARALDEDPALDVVYTDQESVEADGSAAEPFRKPDWSPTLLLGVMYVGHLLAVRRELAIAAGGFDSRFDNVQDFELMLRLSERTDRIAHVPSVLYRWRRVPGSIAFAEDAKAGVEELQAVAVTQHLERRRVPARARPHPTLPHRAELVPLAAVKDVEVVVVAPSTSLHEAAASIDAELFVTIETGAEPEDDDWLAQLALHARMAEAGVVAPLVLGPAGHEVADAGLVIGRDGELEPALRGLDARSDGYAGSLACAREVVAVSGVCAMVATATLERLGGFSELYAEPAAAWRDLSLRAHAAGLRNVVTPRAAVRRTGAEPPLDPLDAWLLRDAWAEALAAGDPYAGGHVR